MNRSRPFTSTVRVGTAAEGAAIKEGSYLVHEGALVQIIGGEPQAVAVRDGKGTEGIPAKHARIIRSLIAVRDAVREVLRAQANDEPWGWLARLDEGPQGRLHGDAVPGNFLARQGEDVVAVDWQCAGVGPVGSDIGYYALSAREEFDVLLAGFLDGVGQVREGVDPVAVEVAARVTAVYSVLSRAEWALAQVARGEGALAGKYRHPAVAPHLRAVERQFPQIEGLLA